jgi:hypothetical protein
MIHTTASRRRASRGSTTTVLLLLATLAAAGPAPAADAEEPPPAAATSAATAAGTPTFDGRGRVFTSDAARRARAVHTPPAGLAAPAAQVLPLAPPTASLVVSSADGFAEKWRWVSLGDEVGQHGLVVADIDGDGTRDVLCTGTGNAAGAYAYVLHAKPAGGYEETWAVPGNAYAFARAAQLDADPALEVLVGNAGDIRVYDGASHELEHTLTTTASALHGLEAADVDHDGDIEVVAIDASNLYVYDLATGTQQAKKTGFGGAALALGQIDGDPQPEIGIAQTNGAGLVLDGITLAADWGTPSGFGPRIAFGDLDGDGLDEVATATYSTVRAYDPVPPGPEDLLYEQSYDNGGISALAIADVAGDGAGEVVFLYWSGLQVLDGDSGAPLWSVSSYGIGGGAVAAGDADDDGVTEVLWGGTASSFGGQTLHVADATTHDVEWESVDLDGPFYGLDAGDIDRDGDVEVLTTSFENDNGYSDGRFLFLDGATGGERFVSGPTGDVNWNGVWQARMANIDADPQLEVCMTTSVAPYQGQLACYDGVTHAEQWHVAVDDGLAIVSIEFADVDGNGVLDVLAGTAKVSSGAAGVYVFAYRASNGVLLWRTPDLTSCSWGNFVYLRAVQLDADLPREVIAGDLGYGFRVIDGLDGAVDFTSPCNLEISAMATPDRDHDGRAELLVGNNDGAILRLDTTDASVVETVFSGLGYQVNGLAVADLDDDGVDDYAYGLDVQLIVRSGATHGVLLSSDFLGFGTGAVDAVRIAELDGDAAPEIVVDTGAGVAAFDTPGPLVFVDGFAHALGRWSETWSPP